MLGTKDVERKKEKKSQNEKKSKAFDRKTKKFIFLSLIIVEQLAVKITNSNNYKFYCDTWIFRTHKVWSVRCELYFNMN